MDSFFRKVLLFFVLSLLGASSLGATEVQSLNLPVDSGLYTKLCPLPLWKNTRVVWRGVTDKRANPEIGRVTKKFSDSQISVLAQPELAAIFDAEIRKLLSTCGVEWVSDGGTTLRFDVENFSSEEKKGILTGKGLAQSRLSFVAEKPNHRISGNVGYQIEFKQTRKSGVKNLERALRELLRETLTQLLQSPQLRDL